MTNKEYIEELIKKSKKKTTQFKDGEILQTYNEIQEVLKSDKYTKEEKELLHKEAWIESLAMMI